MKPDQWVELKSPYASYKASNPVPISKTVRLSRYNKIMSRAQTGISIGIEETDESDTESNIIESQKVKPDVSPLPEVI